MKLEDKILITYCIVMLSFGVSLFTPFMVSVDIRVIIGCAMVIASLGFLVINASIKEEPRG